MTIGELKTLKLQETKVCEECGAELDEEGNCPECGTGAEKEEENKEDENLDLDEE